MILQDFPHRIFVDPEARNYDLTQKIIAFASERTIPVQTASKREAQKAAMEEKDPLGFGKRSLYLGIQKGEFLKSCPCTRNYICCGYHILNTANNCPLDCSYCVLQNYLSNPLVVLYVNLERLFDELRKKLKRAVFRRIGTGELTDSLALERWAPTAADLVSFFSEMENAALELKTKTSEIGGFLSVPHRGRTIVAWSLNPPELISHEEKRTAPLEERIQAAQWCQEAGFPLAFHFDPVVQIPGWEEEYSRVVEVLFSRIDWARIAWISLGCLRFPPSLKRIMMERFPESPLPFGEFVPGLDGKMRYLRTFRIQAYSHLVREIRRRAKGVFLYCCMESPEVWKASLGFIPRNLPALLDERARAFFKGVFGAAS